MSDEKSVEEAKRWLETAINDGLEDAKSGIRYAKAFLTTVKSVFDVL